MNIASHGLVIAGWILILAYSGVILFFVIRGALKTKSIQDYVLIVTTDKIVKSGTMNLSFGTVKNIFNLVLS